LAIAYVLTPERAVRVARKIADIAAMDQDTNPADVNAAIAAAKFLAERLNGKPRQNVETNSTQTLTLEKRQEIVHRFFNIEASDATLQFGSKLSPELGAAKAPLALPNTVLDKYEPKGALEEVATDRGDIRQCVQERQEEDAPQEGLVAAGPSLQQQGREK